MIASKITKEQLEQAARCVGLLVEVRALSGSGLRHRVKVYPVVPDTVWQVASNCKRKCPRCGASVLVEETLQPFWLQGSCGHTMHVAQWAGYRRWKGKRGDAPYQRTSRSIMFHPGRRVHAVCWHGFRDYFRACFKLVPDAVFKTSVDTWRGSEDFEARYRESGTRNYGSAMCPVAMCDACRCPEQGRVE